MHIEIIAIIALFIFIVLFAISRKYDKEFISGLDKKKEPLYILYPMSGYLLNIFHKLCRKKQEDKRTEELRKIFVSENPENSRKKYEYKYAAYAISIFMLSVMLGLLAREPEEEKLLEGRLLERPDYAEGNDEVDLRVQTEDGFSKDMKIKLKYRQLDEKERLELVEKGLEYLEKQVLGENVSNDEVRSRLNFASKVPGTDLKVIWMTNDPGLIDYNGEILGDNLDEEGTLASVTVSVEYEKEVYERDIFFRVYPPLYGKEEGMYQQIERAVDEQDNATADKDYLALPEEVSGEPIRWVENNGTKGGWLLLLGIAAAIFMKVALEKELAAQVKKRENELLYDYPEFISKMTLLLGAGMTVKSAWDAMLAEYEGKKTNRYVYEEMKVTRHQLMMGMSEIKAYEEFGLRCRLMPYLRFSTIVTQNLKKGSKGIIPLLESEANEAFEERKGIAERLGEEASTKLLMPMIGMLVIVLVIVMVPAFMSFGV